MATVHGMSYDQIRDNWKDTESCHTITAKRRFDCTVTAIDISPQAMAYGSKVGLFDKTFVADLNGCGASARAEVESAMTAADIFICAAALVYLDLDAIDQLVAAFAATDKEGYAMVNFLSFFAAEKTDETKKILLKHLDFVGSTASRHRRMSPLEQSNYPGEEWVLLEVWVLKRKASP
uniref:Uncharacterized protein n=1 Tax=Craspedostauros australis TaxID=1486917 RepID=A0A7R9WQV0_9STRA|mmetsp:Transcript_1662/g.4585  ORF Transcript_1662/g.4585 Transcript_1662/m.4585 type:complete len:178 (+) Transcript_1662:743-1276(+)